MVFSSFGRCALAESVNTIPRIDTEKTRTEIGIDGSPAFGCAHEGRRKRGREELTFARCRCQRNPQYRVCCCQVAMRLIQNPSEVEGLGKFVLVEAAGVEPASENVTGQETTCLFAFMPQALPWDVRGRRSERTRNGCR